MKNIITLFALYMISVCCSFAQTSCTIQSDNFSTYNTSQKIGPQSNLWTTWSGNEGGTEDGTVSSPSGNKMLRIHNDGIQDVIYQLGNRNTGIYELNWEMWSGNGGYFNIQANQYNRVSGGVFQVFLNTNGSAQISTNGGGSASFSHPIQSWIDVKLTANFNTGYYHIQIGSAGFQLSSVQGLALGAINFYANTGSNFYVDNIELLDLDCNDGGGNTGNISCNDAIPLPCGQSYSSTTISGTNDFVYNDFGTCANGISAANNPYTANDKFFEISVPTTSTLTINMMGLSKDLDLFLFDDCSNSYGGGDGVYTNANLSTCVDNSHNSGNDNEQIIVENAYGTYYLVVDGFNTSQQSNFTLDIDCSNCTTPVPVTNCNYISYQFTGNASDNTYTFEVPNTLTSGTWKFYRNNSLINSTTGRTAYVQFTTDAKHTICYEYTDYNGCPAICCKDIDTTNPFNCQAINVNYLSNDTYSLSLPGVSSSNVQMWVDDETGSTLGTNASISISNPAPNNCRYISVYFYDTSIGAYRVCCKEVCSQCPTNIDNDCNLISYEYTGNNGSLAYTFSVPNSTPSGNWTYKSGNNTYDFGSSKTQSKTFNSAGAYEICFSYNDYNGCPTKCCVNIYVNNPLSCNLINQVYNESNGTFQLSLPGISNSDVSTWIDDATNTLLETNDASITVDAAPPSQCRTISVYFYDATTGCYRICCITICTPGNTPDCCNEDICEIPWLADRAQELFDLCDDFGVIIQGLQKGLYQGQCVYIEPQGNVYLDNLGVVYDCNGTELFSFGGFGEINLDLFSQVSGITTIWTCNDGVPCPSNPTTCCSEEELAAWLPDVVGDIEAIYGCSPTIECCTYNGIQVIDIQPVSCVTDAQGFVYTCDGQQITIYGGIAGFPVPNLSNCQTIDVGNNDPCLLVDEDFETYSVGAISPQSTLWDAVDVGLSSNDANVITESNDKVLHVQTSFVHAGSYGVNDLDLGNLNTSAYELTWQMNVPQNNLLTSEITLFKNSSNAIFNISFKAGTGTLAVLGQSVSFSYPQNVYFEMKVQIDTESGQVQFFAPNSAFPLGWIDFGLQLHKLRFLSEAETGMFIDDIKVRDLNCGVYGLALDNNIEVIDFVEEAKKMEIEQEDTQIELASTDISTLPSPANMDVVKVSNYPNPFSISTTIEFDLPTKTDLTLSILNAQGTIVHQVEATYAKGQNSFVFENTDNLPAGIYFVKLNGEKINTVHTMLLSK